MVEESKFTDLDPGLMKDLESMVEHLNKQDKGKKIESLGTIISFLALYATDSPVLALGVLETSKMLLVETAKRLDLEGEHE